jgi:hypothetical protein
LIISCLDAIFEKYYHHELRRRRACLPLDASSHVVSFRCKYRLDPSISTASDDSLNGWSYSSALAYIVDANRGRSSTAVATGTNNAFRGIATF